MNLKCVVYWLVSEDFKSTYVGSSNNIERRIKEHRSRRVKTTENFGKFSCYTLECFKNLSFARKREKYWKSAIGRKKLKVLFEKIKDKRIIMPRSSSLV